MTSQALPRSDAEQLRDARTANGLLRVRLTEQEALVAQYRARADALEARVEALEAHLGAAMSLVAERDAMLAWLLRCMD